MLLGLRAITAASILFAAAASFAPFQCASEARPELRREEEPAEALYNLAEQFKAQGKAGARAETLRYIVKMYPTSRFAESARLDLEGLAEPASGGPATNGGGDSKVGEGSKPGGDGDKAGDDKAGGGSKAGGGGKAGADPKAAAAP